MYNIIDFGAKPNEETNCAPYVQQAVDACRDNGGGAVYIPAGTYIMSIVPRPVNEIFSQSSAQNIL